jgi:hypothetical protein
MPNDCPTIKSPLVIVSIHERGRARLRRKIVTAAANATNERETIARFTKDDSWPNILLSLPLPHLDA